MKRIIKNYVRKAGELAQQLKVLTILSEVPGTIPSTHIHSDSQMFETPVPEGSDALFCPLWHSVHVVHNMHKAECPNVI